MRSPTPKSSHWTAVALISIAAFGLVYAGTRALSRRLSDEKGASIETARQPNESLEALRRWSNKRAPELANARETASRQSDPTDPVARILGFLKTAVAPDENALPAPASAAAKPAAAAATALALTQAVQTAVDEAAAQTTAAAPASADSNTATAQPQEVEAAVKTVWTRAWDAFWPLARQSFGFVWNLLRNGLASIPSALANAGVKFTVAPASSPPAATAPPLQLNINVNGN